MTPLRPRPGAGALGGPLVHVDVVGSTNDRARELAVAGAPAGTVVIAERQTAGRGRQGRSWSAPAGRDLTLSAIVRRPTPQLEPLPLAVAVAVCEACEAVVPVTCRVKWPNDVWVDGRKLAGILIEARPLEGWAVVGIGVNVDTPRDEFPPQLRESAASLRSATGRPIDREAVLDSLFARLADWIDRLDDPGAVAAAFRTRDALYMQRISWTAAGAAQQGKAQGVDDDGSLIVFTDAGERLTLDAGEVHLERQG